MRLRFEHAAAARAEADPIVVDVAAAAPYAQHTGYGETLARPYVTGETGDSVVQDVATLFAPQIATISADSFIAAIEQIDALPDAAGGRVVCAARAAVELALLDLAGRAFRRRPADAAGWLGLPGFGAPGSLGQARYSGIVVGRDRRRLQRMLRVQRCYGLRDFKLKVATPGWRERLDWTWEILRGPIERERATLRVDANAGWSLADFRDALPFLKHRGVEAIEQPLPECHDADLAVLGEETPCRIIADESLITADDAERLIREGGVDVFNIRLAKNGGLLPSLRLARRALSAGIGVQLGCLVGETSILSAAGLAFLEACPEVGYVEGAFGGFLMRGDVTRRPIRFGYGGRVRPRRGFGLGVDVQPELLARWSASAPVTCAL